MSIADQPHGSPSTYTNWHCRCDPCREAHAKYKRDHRAAEKAKKEARRARANVGKRVVNLEDLLVECWCRCECVWVPRQDVKNGLTNSCARPFCKDEPA